MESTEINLLPEQALEALQHDKLHKQKMYYLLAVGITLVILTLLGIVVYTMFVKTIEGREELLQDQSNRLEDLNPLWNDIIRLNQNKLLFPGVVENTEQIRTVFEAVLEGLNTLTLVEFINSEPASYSIELISPSKEESKRFDEYLRNEFPNAETQKIETIMESDDEVFFRITLTFSAAK